MWRLILTVISALACLGVLAQTWPADTFRWFYNDSIPTKELKAKAQSGDPIAMNDYAASVYLTGRTADEMAHKSRKHWLRAAKAGAPRALLYVAAFDSDADARWLEYLELIYRSEDGDAVCCVADFITERLIKRFRNLDNSYVDRFYLRAARLGNKKAQREIAGRFVFAKGNSGLKTDIDSAYHYLKKSGTYKANLFRTWAFKLYPLGGDTVGMIDFRPADAAAILRYVIADNEDGSGESFLSGLLLGDLYYEHFHDWEAAFACYKAVACDDEWPDGEYTAYLRGRAYERLARCYRFGRGVEVDAAEADRLTRLAAQSGNQNAEIIIDSLIHAE